MPYQVLQLYAHLLAIKFFESIIILSFESIVSIPTSILSPFHLFDSDLTKNDTTYT